MATFLKLSNFSKFYFFRKKLQNFENFLQKIKNSFFCKKPKENGGFKKFNEKIKNVKKRDFGPGRSFFTIFHKNTVLDEKFVKKWKNGVVGLKREGSVFAFWRVVLG